MEDPSSSQYSRYCNIEYQGKAGSSAVMFYVVPIAAQSILGLADCVTLGLIERIHTFPGNLTHVKRNYQSRSW